MKRLKCYYWSRAKLKFEYNHDTTYSNVDDYFFLYHSTVRDGWFAYTNIIDVNTDEFLTAFKRAEYNTYRYLQTMKHKHGDHLKIDDILYELETINRYV